MSDSQEQLKKEITIFFKYYKENDPELFLLYFDKLKEYDIEKISKRLNEFIESGTSHFLPKIGEITYHLQKEPKYKLLKEPENDLKAFKPGPEIWINMKNVLKGIK